MVEAYLVNVDRNAPAKLYAKSGMEFGGVPDTPYGTAKEACAAAIRARDSGEYAHVRVWVDGSGFIEFPKIEELHDYWAANPD